MVLKPSEKVPFTMTKVVELLKEAGLPDGVVNLVHGTADGTISSPCIRPLAPDDAAIFFSRGKNVIIHSLNPIPPFFVYSRQRAYRP